MGVPGPNDTAIISLNNFQVNMSASASVGTLQMTNNSTIQVAGAGTTLTVGGGTINGGNFNGFGILIFNGATTFDGTCILATSTITVNGSLTVNTGVTTATNNTVAVSSGGSITGATGTGGIYKFQSSSLALGGTALIAGNIATGTNATFLINNAQNLVGTLTCDNQTAVFNGTGSLAITGTMTVLTGINVSIPITVSSTVLFDAGVNGPGSMSVISSKAVTFNGAVTMKKGTGINVASGSSVTCNSTVMLTDVAAINGAGDFIVGSGAVLTSTNVFNASNPFSAILTNQGTINVTSGILSSGGGVAIAGSINGNGGTFAILNGTLSVSGTAALSGSIEVDTNAGLTINKTLSLTGTLTFDNQNPTLAGNGTLTIVGAFNVKASGNLNLSSLIIPTGSTMTFGAGVNGAGSLAANSPAQITCNGTLAMNLNTSFNLATGVNFTCSGNVTMDRIAGSGGSGTFALSSTATLTSTNNSATNFLACFVTNAGAISSQTGILRMDNYTQTAGSLTLAGGNLQSSNALLINGGTLTGAGTINGSVTSAATVAPGQAGVGALTITGNYTQTAAGTLNLELGGATVGQFDRVISSGSATLDGTLNLALTNGYVPTASDTLAIMSFASRSGQFATLSAGGSGFIALYTNTAVTLAAASGNPNPVPGVTTIAPTSATAGGASFMLTVNGTNFINSSVIKFNNNARTTTFVSATQLTAVIPSSDIAAAGTPGVTVTNPTPGGGTSTAVTFTINASGGGGAVAPVISSTLSAAGLKNIPFTYIISATGTSPITFGASGLPAGLAVDTTTGIISGTPTASGGFDVVLSAQNSAGSNSKTLRITILAGTGSNAPPAFTSVPTASPNPANVSQTVTFTAAASDPDGDSVTISWDFGDGSKGSGASVTHAYAAAGIYAVNVAASDGISSDTSSLTVAVNTTTPPNAGSFSVTKGAIKFTFSAQNKDAIGLLGIVPLASGTQLSGAQVTLNFGGITKSFTLTDKGSGGDKNNLIKLSGKIKNGALTAANPQFLISIKSQTLFAGLSDFFTNDTVAKPGETDTVPVILTINGTSFVDLVNFNYISTAGKSGTGKLVP